MTNERWYDVWICLFLGFPGLILVEWLMKRRIVNRWNPSLWK